MTGQMPLFGMKATPLPDTMDFANTHGSTVFAMIESKGGVENVESIAAVDGVDVLLVGSVDLSIDLGNPGQLHSSEYKTSMETISAACRKYGKIMGVAGVYDSPELQDWIINTLGARFMLVQQDAGLIYGGGVKAIQSLPGVKSANEQE